MTGCKSIPIGFPTIEEARNQMKEWKVQKYDEVLKDGAGETAPLHGAEAFYAVANGKRPGIYPYWQYVRIFHIEASLRSANELAVEKQSPRLTRFRVLAINGLEHALRPRRLWKIGNSPIPQRTQWS